MENPYLDRGSAFYLHITLFKLVVISSLEQGLTFLMHLRQSGTVRQSLEVLL